MGDIDRLAEAVHRGGVVVHRRRRAECCQLAAKALDHRRIDPGGEHRIGPHAAPVLDRIGGGGAGIGIDRALGGAVGGEGRLALDRGDGGHVDDRAPAVCGHGRNGVLGAEDDTVDADRHDLAVVGLGQRFGIAEFDDAGIVDEDVEPPMARHDIGNERFPCGFAGDVEVLVFGIGAELSGEGAAACVVNVGKDHPRTFCHEQPRIRRTEALGRAGDDGDFAFQTVHVLTPPASPHPGAAGRLPARPARNRGSGWCIPPSAHRRSAWSRPARC